MVHDFAKVKITRPDAGFEDKGGIDELKPCVMTRGEVKGGNGFVELWDTETACERHQVLVGWWFEERRRSEFWSRGKREAQTRHGPFPVISKYRAKLEERREMCWPVGWSVIPGRIDQPPKNDYV